MWQRCKAEIFVLWAGSFIKRAQTISTQFIDYSLFLMQQSMRQLCLLNIKHIYVIEEVDSLNVNAVVDSLFVILNKILDGLVHGVHFQVFMKGTVFKEH